MANINWQEALTGSFRKLNPRDQLRNPVMFVVYIGAMLITGLGVAVIAGVQQQEASGESATFILAIGIWLWFTVLFANFAESIAESRGKAQAESLRRSRQQVTAKKLRNAQDRKNYTRIPAASLRQGDIVYAEVGDMIPGDGQVLEGIAAVDESAITGESAPVIRESGGDRDAVTGGTRILSDWLVIRITANPGESFIERMITLVEGARRQKTPNEIALSILLAAMTVIFLLATATLLPFSWYSVKASGAGGIITLTVLVSLLVCLAPTTIGGLLSAIGIAGMNRLLKANVIASSGRAVEAAGDVNVLLLDKTGTITHGNRQATNFLPAPGVSAQQLAAAAQLASLSDDTPEGKSIVALAQNKFAVKSAERDFRITSRSCHPRESGDPERAENLDSRLRGNDNTESSERMEDAEYITFSAETRISGVRLGDREILKGAGDAIAKRVGALPAAVMSHVEAVARQGGTPLVVIDGKQILGVVHLKDVLKAGIKERLAELRRMGIKSVMITGDNPLTAAAIAAEAGVDDFLAEATPEAKLKLIRQWQMGGELVAMVGDGTNDAPALAQADVAVAMNSGTQAAKEAANMIDLDSNPTKLIEVVEIGKQLLMTRGALTTFSIANDLAKYFAIIPAAFVTTYPALAVLNVMGLASPQSAILSAVIFNALIIVALIPLALRGVKYRPANAATMLRYNALVYGLGGVIVPFIGIKLIDMLLAATGLA